MLGALTSPVKAAPGGRGLWAVNVAAFTGGGLLSGALVGAAAAAGGRGLGADLAAPAAAVACLLVAVAVAARELGLVAFPLPYVRRSSGGTWARRWGLPRASLLWGLDIGLVFTTWLAWAGALWLVAVAALSGNPLLGAALMAVFWLGRALPVVVGPWLLPSAAVAPWIDAAVEPLRPAFTWVHALVTLGASALLVAAAFS